jgi:O-antigen ligase
VVRKANVKATKNRCAEQFLSDSLAVVGNNASLLKAFVRRYWEPTLPNLNHDAMEVFERVYNQYIRTALGEVKAGRMIGSQTTTLICGENAFHRTAYCIVILSIWFLAFGAYRPAGREIPIAVETVDWIALTKIVSRVFVVVLLGYTCLRASSTRAFKIIRHRLTPFFLFALWALLSASWSPLKAVSFGKAFGLVVFALLSAVTAWVCVDERVRSKTLFHVGIMLLVVNVANFLSFIFLPVGDIDPRGGFFMTKNDAAQNAGILIIILLVANIRLKWRWAKNLLVPGVGVSVGVLYLANSRTATFVTLAVICLSLILLLNLRQLIMLSFFPIVLAIILLCIDPVTDLLNPVYRGGQAYFMRGQTGQEFLYVTGRPDKWKLAVEGFLDSPIIGQGYDVTSRTAFQYLYGSWQVINAHNLYLHILCGTGLVGMALFAWGIWNLIAPLFSPPRGVPRDLAILVLLSVMWFFGIGLLELAFVSSVNSPGVVASVLFGIAVGIEASGRVIGEQSQVAGGKK